MPAATAIKLLSAGCAGFLMSMPGAHVNALKAVYDYRTGEDFGRVRQDCEDKGNLRYMEIEVFDKNLRPIIDAKYTQVGDECGNPLAEEDRVEWPFSYDWKVNGTLENDELKRLQMDMYFCSPNGYFELEVTVRSDNGFDADGNPNKMDRVAWEIEYGPDQYHIWDTLNTPFWRFANDNFHLRANGGTQAQRPYAPIPPFCEEGCDGEYYKWPYDDAEGYYSKLLTSPFPPLKCPNLYPTGVDYIGCFPAQVGWTQMTGPPTDADSNNPFDDAEVFRMYDGLIQNNIGQDSLAEGPDMGLATDGVMYPEKCADMCSGYSYFGLSKATECVCGNEVTGENVPKCGLEDDNKIPEYQYLCTGDPAFLCGTDTMYEIYTLDGSSGPNPATPAPVTPAPAATPAPAGTPAPTDDSTPPGTGGYVELGCAREERPAGFRVMEFGPITEDTMSAAICYDRCTTEDPAFAYFGTEWGVQCWCSEAIPDVSLSWTRCNYDCAGTPDEICGGYNAITVYEITGSGPATTPSPVDVTPSPVDATPSPVTPSPVDGTPAPATPAPATPAPIADTASYDALGCWRDLKDGARILDVMISEEGDDMSADICFAACVAEGADYTYFGMQFNFQCWCGTSFDPSVERERPTKCTYPCTGNPDQTCGGYDHVQLYEIV